MRKKLLLITVLIAIITLIGVLSACQNKNVAGIAISEDSVYKTDYVVGEEFDLSGIKLAVSYSDGSIAFKSAEELRDEIKILNFSAASAKTGLIVVIEYKGFTATFNVDVSTADDAAEKLTVTFASGAGNNVAPVLVPKYGTLATPTDPQLAGYVFDGWYKEAACVNLWNFNTDKVTSDITLYAKWSKLYTVTFHTDLPQGYTGPITSVDDVYRYVKAGNTLSDVPAVTPFPGYTGSWSRTVFTNVNANIEVQAVYRITTYTVGFYYMDGSGNSISLRQFTGVKYGSDMTDPATIDPSNSAGLSYYEQIAALEPPPTIGHTHFDGWDTGFNYITGNLTVYAKYVTNSYSVTFDLNYSEAGNWGEPQSVLYEAAVSRPSAAPERAGYQFDGWYTTADGATKWNFDTERVVGNTIIYAHWTQLFHVRFYIATESGDPVDTVYQGQDYKLWSTLSVRSGDAAEFPAVPEREGYTSVWDKPPTSSVSNNIDVYALYTIKSFGVTFNGYGATPVISTVTYGSSAVNPIAEHGEPVRTGYTFAGWDTDFSYVTANITVNPVFTANQYPVNVYKFPNSSGAYDSYETVVIEFGQKPALAEPSRESYSFDGWYKATIFTPENRIDMSSYVLDTVNPLSLYAKWLKNHSVQFYRADGSFIKSFVVTDGAKASSSLIPSITPREGHTGYWADYSGGSAGAAVDLNLAVTSEISVVEAYTINSYTVNYIVNNSSYDTETVLYGAFPVRVPSEAAIGGFLAGKGRKFENAWKLSENASIHFSETEIRATAITKDTTIYAVLSLVQYKVEWYTDAETLIKWTSGGVEQTFTMVEHDSRAVIPEAGYQSLMSLYTGYSFVRWVNFTGNGVSVDSITADTKFKADMQLNSYSATFVRQYDGGTVYTPASDIDHGSYLNLEEILRTESTAIAREGYSFSGWNAVGTTTNVTRALRCAIEEGNYYWYYDNASLTSGTQYAVNGDIIIDIDGTVYITDSPRGSFGFVNLNNNWRNSPGVYPLIESAVGWYVGENHYQYDLVYFTGELIFVMGQNHRFLAQYERNYYTVTFDSDPADIYGEDLYWVYDFTGSGSGYRNITKPLLVSTTGALFSVGTNTVDILAAFPKYSSTYDLALQGANFIRLYDGATYSDFSVKLNVYADISYIGYYGDSLRQPANPTLNGYVFLGWYTTPDYANLFDFSSTLTSNVTLYGKWGAQITNATPGITYSLTDGGVAYEVTSIDGVTAGTTDIIVGNYYQGLPVVAIGSGAFDGSAVVSVTLPDTLSLIGVNAFLNCSSLVSIEIPALTAHIGDNAFNGCTSLTSVEFQNNSLLASIGDSVFFGCTALRYSSGSEPFVLPSGLSSIGAYAFYNCASLRSITIPASVLSIGNYAFSRCGLLHYAIFERPLPMNIGTNVFLGYNANYSVFRVYVPDVAKYSVFSSNWSALSSKLLSVAAITPDGEWSYATVAAGERVGAKLIQYLGSDLEVTVPDSIMTSSGSELDVVGFGDYCFGSLVTGVSLTSQIGFDQHAFSSALSLSSLTIVIISGRWEISGTYLKAAYNDCPSLNKLSVSPVRTAQDIFGGDAPAGLKYVEILGTNVFNYIVEDMFENCTGLIEVTFNSVIAEIRNSAFAGCTSLRAVYIYDDGIYAPAASVSIGAGAFENSISLADFYYNGVEGLPSTISSVGDGAFDNTEWLTNYEYDYVVIGDGVLYLYTGTGETVSIDNSVKKISSYAFYGNSVLRHVFVESPADSLLTEIGDYAFAGCTKLESAVFSQNLVLIGDSAFEGCSKLAVAVLPSQSVPAIGDSAFSGTLRRNNASALVIYVNGALLSYYPAWLKTAYTVQAADNIELVADGDAYWLVSDAVNNGASNAYTLRTIKYITSGTTAVVPSALTVSGDSKNIVEIGDYAFNRSLVELTVSVTVAASTYAFGGVTALTTLTIQNSSVIDISGVKLSGEVLNALFNANRSMSVLNTSSKLSIYSLLGNHYTPANVRTVRIAEGENLIADEFLYGCASVETIYWGGVLLENTLAEQAPATIGAKAFRGTAWASSHYNANVIIFEDVLVDYIGAEKRIYIEDISAINANVFEGNTSIEEVYFLDNKLTHIGDGAFRNASKLSKVFATGTTAAPALGGNAFAGNAPGFVIYTDTASLASFIADINWWSIYNAGGLLAYDFAGRGLRTENFTATGSTVYGGQSVTYKDFEFIVGVSDGGSDMTLLAYGTGRKYYLAGELYACVESVSAAVPETCDLGGGVYNVTALGRNPFLSVVQKLTLRMNDAAAAEIQLTVEGAPYNVSMSFANLSALYEITVLGTALPANYVFTSAGLLNLVKVSAAHVAQITINYAADVTLDTLLGTTAPTRPSSITTVGILNGATTTVPLMLYGWSNVKTINFCPSLTSLGVNSFEGTHWYINYKYAPGQSGYVIINSSILYKYKGTSTSVNVPASVKVINAGAFSNASGDGSTDEQWSTDKLIGVIRFESGSKATTIGAYAFADLDNLNPYDVTFPGTIKYIASNAFYNCANIIETNNMLIISGTGGGTLIKYTGNAETVTIPATVSFINANAFYANTTVTQITCAPGSILTTVGENAFFGCTALSTIVLPATVTSIGQGALHETPWFNARSGSNIVFNQNAGKILYHYTATGDFTVTSDYISITIGAVSSVGKIELQNGAFIPQNELLALLSLPTVTSFGSNGLKSLAELIGTDDKLPNITTLFFVAGTVSVANYYAYGWSSVTTVDFFGNDVRSVGIGAFEGTAWINHERWLDEENNGFVTSGGLLIKYVGTDTRVVIPAGVTALSQDAFRGNTVVQEIFFAEGSGITEIPANCFSGCISLYKIMIPAAVNLIGEDAFKGTMWVRGEINEATENAYLAEDPGYEIYHNENFINDCIVFNGMLAAYSGEGGLVTIPASVSKIYTYVFAGNTTITDVVFDRLCLMSELSYGIFAGCSNLMSITFNQYMESIDPSALTGTKFIASVGNYIYYTDSFLGVKKILYYNGTSASVTIAADVTGISASAFRGNTRITSVTFAASGKLTAIPDYAFADCVNLTTVLFNQVSKVVNIGVNAFYGTPWLAARTDEFSIINGVLVAYNGTATEVIIPATVTAVYSAAFAGNTEITSVDFSLSKITAIPEGLFEGCTALQNVIFNSQIASVGGNAFAGTPYYGADGYVPGGNNVIIINGILVKYFYDTANTAIVIPESVKYINPGIFAGDTNLVSVEFTGYVEIGEYAFEDCTNLSTVIGGSYIGKIGLGAFDDTAYQAASAAESFTVIGGVLIAYRGTGDVVIPANVKYIASYAFNGNKNITSVSFASTEGLSIAAGAFAHCVSLATVTGFEKVLNIGSRAFYGTPWQTNYLGELLTVNGRILYYFENASSIYIDSTVTSIGAGVFEGNTGITALTFAGNCSVAIPENAFRNCTSLSGIVFPSVAFSIGKNAFQNTSWLNSKTDYIVVNGMLIAYRGTSRDISIPSTVTKVYDYVFAGNTTIQSLIFPSSSITSLSGGLFKCCSALASVTLPAGLTYLDPEAFAGTPWYDNYDSSFLVSNNVLLRYLGTSPSVVIPAGVRLGIGAFQGNTHITSVDFTSNATITEIPAKAFYNCANLATVTLSPSIRSIANDAFVGTAWYNSLADGAYIWNGCLLFVKGGATALAINSSVTYIGAGAFAGTSVTQVTFSSTNPCAVATGALAGLDIYVPANALTAYKTAWATYASRIFASA